jgi:hypothetical protein
MHAPSSRPPPPSYERALSELHLANHHSMTMMPGEPAIPPPFTGVAQQHGALAMTQSMYEPILER